MTTCIKDFYDYHLVKRCSKCGIIPLKSNFHKNKSKNDGLKAICKFCRKKYYLENRYRIVINQKLYNKQNRDKINNRMKEYLKNRKKSDTSFKLACNLKSRTSKAFKPQNVRKIKKTFDLRGCSQSFFKRWILYQLYGDMTGDNYSGIWCLDHCYPSSKTNLLDKIEMNKSTGWINSRPMYCSEKVSKGDKIDNRLYLMREVKAKHFSKLNEEGYNEDIH